MSGFDFKETTFCNDRSLNEFRFVLFNGISGETTASYIYTVKEIIRQGSTLLSTHMSR